MIALDLRGISTFTDFFVICSGDSEPQLKAIADAVQERVREEHGRKAAAVDGYPTSQWVVIDYHQVIVHVFHSARRAHYALEDLWSDAPRLELG